MAAAEVGRGQAEHQGGALDQGDVVLVAEQGAQRARLGERGLGDQDRVVVAVVAVALHRLAGVALEGLAGERVEHAFGAGAVALEEDERLRGFSRESV